MTMTIRLSSLAARYYVRDGWSLDIINKYLTKGHLHTQNFLYRDDEYYILSVGSRIDVDKLLADYPDIKVIPVMASECDKTTKELLESRNW